MSTETLAEKLQRHYFDGPKLLDSAEDTASWRGHKLKRWGRISDTLYRAACSVCGMEVDVNTNPPPNGIDISGEAIALDCPTGESAEPYGS